MKHNLETYLNEYETLTPSDTQVGEGVVASDWWSGLKSQFDELIWLYYPSRTIFMNERFNPEDTDTTYTNIVKTFSIWIKSHKRMLDGLYKGFIVDFHPEWNVDGVEGFVSKDMHTGTTTEDHTGDDRLTYEDNGNTRRSGNESIASSGTDTDTRQVKTFDDGTNWKDESKNSAGYGKTDTHTYNNVTDTKDLDGFKNQNYDSTVERTNDLLDEHVDIKMRQGNIGVVSTVKLLQENRELFTSSDFDFYKYVVHSCVNQVSYAVEGVL